MDEFAQSLFEGSAPWAKIRQGHKLLRLGERYSPQRLDAACRKAISVDLVDVRRLERILVQALEEETLPQLPCLCRRAASPVPAASSPMPKEVSHDPNHRTHAAAQTSAAGTHGRHPARAHRSGPKEQLDYASFLEIILSDEINRRLTGALNSG